MKEYYDQIKAHGYEGTCSFEICDRRYYIDPDKAIDDTVAWMRANTHELDKTEGYKGEQYHVDSGNVWC